MPAPESTYIRVDVLCPTCQGGKAKSRREACDKCGGEGFVAERLSLLSLADMVKKVFPKLP